MRGLERRLVLLEGGRGSDPYAHLSDAELEARYIETVQQIEAQEGGFPAGFEALSWGRQAAWLQDAIEERRA